MWVRRCAVLLTEPRETSEFRFELLLQGGDGVARSRAWYALAPHLDEPVLIDAPAQAWLGTLSAQSWTLVEADTPEAALAATLLGHGLLIAQDDMDSAPALRDARLRGVHWHPLAAVMHAFSRWDGVDAVRNMQESETETAEQMRQTLGEPPREAPLLACVGARLALPEVDGNDFDQLLSRRVTCRNFDPDRPVPLAMFAQLLQRTFGSRTRFKVGEDLVFLKKNVPSGGGLHPIEAYLVVQNVEGLEPGLYHYRGDSHELEQLTTEATVDRAFVMQMVGQQHWFADAHVLVVLAPRFERTFWKYRQHAKSYRVVAMEAGHLSQTLYLAATDAGLGAFITGAINEKHIERALQLDTIAEGVLAVCGFGWRAAQMTTTELDPAGAIWQLADA